MTRNQLSVMGLSGRLQRSGVMQSNKSLLTLQKELGQSMARMKLETPAIEEDSGEAIDVGDAASVPPPAGNGAAAHLNPEEDGDDDHSAEAPSKSVPLGAVQDWEVLQALADSYREVTGRAMPEDMTAEQAYAELKMRTIAAWGGDVEMLAAESTDSVKSVGDSEASEDREERQIRKLGKAFKSARNALALARHKGTDAVDVGATAALKEDDWDEQMLEMLKASYREITGRGIPAGMSPAAAEAELRRIMIGTWKDEGNDDLAAELSAKSATWSEKEASDAPASGVAQKRVSKVVDFDEDDEAAAAPAPPSLPSVDEEAPRAIKQVMANPRDLMAVKDEEVSTFAVKPASAKRLQTGKDVFRAGRVGVVEARTSPKVFEGWLKKKGPGMFKRDRRRWFALHEDGSFLYYTGPDLADMKGSLNVSSVGAADVALLDDDAQHANAFTVQTPQRLWTFYCETESQRRAWKKNILAVSNELNGITPSGK